METTIQSLAVADQRKGDRTKLELSGFLYLRADEVSIACTIVNLSTGGAGIVCAEPPPIGTPVVLYVEGFGRFDAVARHYSNGELELEFSCGVLKRAELAEELALYVQHGIRSITQMRRNPRAANSGHARLILSNSEEVDCQLVDLSLQGARVKTNIRPALGDNLFLGRTQGRVIRHEDDGIVLKFLQPS